MVTRNTSDLPDAKRSCEHACCPDKTGHSDEMRLVESYGNGSEDHSPARENATCDCCQITQTPSLSQSRPSCSCCPADPPSDHTRNKFRDSAEQMIIFGIEGLDCADCAANLERGIRNLTGISEARVNFATAKMTVRYLPSLTQASSVEKAIHGFGYQTTVISSGLRHGEVRTSVFRILDLDCADCAAKLEKRIVALPGVTTARVNFAAGTMTVEHTTPVETILCEVEHAGYSAEPDNVNRQEADIRPAWWYNRRTQATIISGMLLSIASILAWLHFSDTIVIPLYAGAALIGGFRAAKSGIYALRSFSFDMNLLMTIAVIGAAAIGEWSEGATVAVLFSFGNMLQTYTMDKTRQSIRALMELAPLEALVRRNGMEHRLPVEEIVIGDLIIAKPGDRIAMDGTVKRGVSSVNQAAITGESIPVEKTEESCVYAGTINENGVLEIEVTKVAADSTLAKIMHLVEEAQLQKAPSQQFVDVFVKYYTPAVLLAALGIIVIPWLVFGQPFTPWFYKGLILLVISCPCALVISTPVSIVAAIGNSSRHGVLIKGGAYLEQMGKIQAMAFDKTGTLTHGRPVVTDIIPLMDQREEDLLVMAASVEKWSEHPLAVAIVNKAVHLTLKPAENFRALVGRGTQAEIGEQLISIGNVRMFEESGVHLNHLQESITGLQNQGKTVMVVGSGDSVLGLIAVADTVRTHAPEAISALRKAGMRHVTMLTGDNRQAAGFIAGKLNLDSYYSDLLPEEKVETVHQLAQTYGTVAMVGDGVNDAPALAAASVGVAMGVAGSDTALETADIALMSDDLGKLVYIISLSRKTVAIIKQNITFAILIKLFFVSFTLFGFVDLWLAVLADMGSSILVTLNGMRLMKKVSDTTEVAVIS